MSEDKEEKLNNKRFSDSGSNLPIQALIAAFEENNPAVREEAVEILVRIGKPSLAQLIHALKSPAAEVRKYAVRVMGYIGDTEVMPALIKILREDETAVREETVEALGKIGGSSAANPLFNALKDKNSLVRGKAAAALDRIGWQPKDNSELSLYAIAKQMWNILPFLGQAAITTLTKALKDEEQSVRDGVVAVLGKMGDLAAVKPIIDADKAFDTSTRTDEPRTAETPDYNDYDFRQKAADVLDKIGWQPANNKEAALYYFARQDWNELGCLGKDAVEPLIIALKDRNPAIRAHAVETLGEIGDAKAVAPLFVSMNDEDASVRNKAVFALGKISDPGTVKCLLAALNDSRYNREKVIDALGEKGDTSAVDYLANALQDTTWEARKYREAAARALGNIKDARAVAPLIAALKSKFYEVRKEAAEALGKIGDIDAVIPLLSALKGEDADFREIAVASLSKIVKSGYEKPLIAALSDQDSYVRQGAAEVLSRTGWQPPGNHDLAVFFTAKQEWGKLLGIKEYAAAPLISVLNDENPEIRKNAVKTLGRIGDPQAVEPLIAASKNHQLFEAYMSELITALGELGDVRAFEHLVNFLNSYLEDAAKSALEKIHMKVSSKRQGLFCAKCFRWAKKNRIKYPLFENNVFSNKSIAYFVCTNCHSNLYLEKKVEKIVLLLDRNLKVPYVREGAIFSVNWLKRPESCDFDEIMIKDAHDTDVEELVLKLRNDTDEKRKERLSSIPVSLSPQLRFSPEKIKLLKDTFALRPGF